MLCRRCNLEVSPSCAADFLSWYQVSILLCTALDVTVVQKDTPYVCDVKGLDDSIKCSTLSCRAVDDCLFKEYMATPRY